MAGAIRIESCKGPNNEDSRNLALRRQAALTNDGFDARIVKLPSETLVIPAKVTWNAAGNPEVTNDDPQDIEGGWLVIATMP